MTNTYHDCIEEVTSLKGYTYQVWEYQASLSQLTVRATHPDKPKHNIHIVFQGVSYFQMPIHWKSGDFRLGLDNERRAVAERIGLNDYDADKYFKAETPNTDVDILGAIAGVLRDVEPIY
jgi:hypothetical protein